MAILELVQQKPDWMGALAVAMTRPPGVPERRSGEDPWNPNPNVDRPRRISDDLAWFRQAFDDPSEHGLQPLDGQRGYDAVAWESDNEAPVAHLVRLRDRGVLQAAGFMLHIPDQAYAATG
jgi:hypothetical protein